MRALVYESFGGPMAVREVPAPARGPGGVVVRVGASGVCRSDWHGWQGHDPDITLPHVPGHELAGTIEAVGDGRRRLAGRRPGHRAVRLRLRHLRRVRGRRPAGLRAPDPAGLHPLGLVRRARRAPRTPTSTWSRCRTTCPSPSRPAWAAATRTAFRAVVHQGRVRPGEWVAVHGCGGVGLSAVQVAVAAGARVVAVDVAPGALALARELGAEAVRRRPRTGRAGVRPRRELTGGGAHLSLDALGSPGTCVGSVLGLRTRGRHVQVGLLPPARAPAVPMDRAVALELELLGSHGMAAHAYPQMLDLVAAGRLRPERLVTRELAPRRGRRRVRRRRRRPGHRGGHPLLTRPTTRAGTADPTPYGGPVAAAVRTMVARFSAPRAPASALMPAPYPARPAPSPGLPPATAGAVPHDPLTGPSALVLTAPHHSVAGRSGRARTRPR